MWLVLVSCQTQDPHDIHLQVPPGAIQMSEGTNPAFGACNVGVADFWDRPHPPDGALRPSAGLFFLHEDGGESSQFVFDGSTWSVCGETYRVIAIRVGHRAGGELLVRKVSP